MQDEELAGRFAELADDALLARLASGELTEQAQAIARAEAKRRGLTALQAGIDTAQEPQQAPPDFVQFSRYLQPMEAYILQGRLAAEGIDAHLAGVDTVGTNPLWFNAMGGVRLFVPRAQCAHARDIMAQREAGDYALQEDAPGAASSDTVKRRFGWIVLVLPALLLPGTCCSNCGCRIVLSTPSARRVIATA